jgi:hypothetical protein
MPPPSGGGSGPGVGTIVLIGALALLVVAAFAVTGVVLWQRAGSDAGDDASEPDASSAPSASAGDPDEWSGGVSDPGGVLASSEVVVPVDADGASTIHRVDVVTGESQSITVGPADGLPSVSPSRTLVAFLTDTATPGKRVRLLDLESGEVRRLFDDDSPCAFANRPAFRPHGQQVALVCSDERREPRGLYLADLDGNVTLLVEDPALGGAPTWVDDDTLMYDLDTGGGEGPKTFWQLDVQTSGAEPVLLDLGDDAAGGAEVSHVDWSPEAGALLFLRTSGETAAEQEFGQIWTVRPPQPPLLLDVPAAVGHPAWSPDGTAIVVLVEDDLGQRGLATFPISDPQQLTRVPETVDGEVGIPAWGTR